MIWVSRQDSDSTEVSRNSDLSSHSYPGNPNLYTDHYRSPRMGPMANWNGVNFDYFSVVIDFAAWRRSMQAAPSKLVDLCLLFLEFDVIFKTLKAKPWKRTWDRESNQLALDTRTFDMWMLHGWQSFFRDSNMNKHARGQKGEPSLQHENAIHKLLYKLLMSVCAFWPFMLPDVGPISPSHAPKHQWNIKRTGIALQHCNPAQKRFYGDYWYLSRKIHVQHYSSTSASYSMVTPACFSRPMAGSLLTRNFSTSTVSFFSRFICICIGAVGCVCSVGMIVRIRHEKKALERESRSAPILRPKSMAPEAVTLEVRFGFFFEAALHMSWCT